MSLMLIANIVPINQGYRTKQAAQVEFLWQPFYEEKFCYLIDKTF